MMLMDDDDDGEMTRNKNETMRRSKRVNIDYYFVPQMERKKGYMVHVTTKGDKVTWKNGTSVSKGGCVCVCMFQSERLIFLEERDGDLVHGRSLHTKHEFPSMCVLGLRPRFFLGICNTVSIVELVNAAMDPCISLFSPADGNVPFVEDDDGVVVVEEDTFDAHVPMTGVAVCLTSHTVGVKKVQPPSCCGSRLLGGRPRRRLRIGCPVGDMMIWVDGGAGVLDCCCCCC